MTKKDILENQDTDTIDILTDGLFIACFVCAFIVAFVVLTLI